MTRRTERLRIQPDSGIGGGEGEPCRGVEVVGIEVVDEDLDAFRLGEGSVEVRCESGGSGCGGCRREVDVGGRKVDGNEAFAGELCREEG